MYHGDDFDLETLFVNVPDPIFALDRDLRLLFCNNAAGRLLGGRLLSELLNRSILDVLPGLVGSAFEDRIRRAIEKEALCECEVWFDSDHSERRFAARISPLPDCGVAVFLLEHKESEDTSEEALFHRACKLAGIGVWEWEVETDQVRWSDEILKLWGYKADEFSGTLDEVVERIHPGDRDAWQESVRACVEEGKTHTIEFRICCPEGIRWVKAVGDLERSEGAGSQKMVGVVVDISKRVSMEQTLNKTAELLDIAGEMARVGGWEIDLKKNTVSWTRTVSSIHEVPENYEPTLEEALEFYPEAGEIEEAVRRAREEGVAYDLEIPFVTAKGNKRWTRAIGRPKFEEGKCVYLHGAFQDITEQKQNEQELRELTRTLERKVRDRTAELKTANRELESFVYSVSHDLRAPLRAVKGFAEIIANRHRDDLNSEGRHYFDNICEASDRMSLLIKELLDYSRLGRDVGRLIQVETSTVIEDVLKTLAVRIEESGAKLEVDPDLPPIMGQDRLLEQVMSNLIDNALKYRRSEEVPEISISWEDEGEWVVLKVADNGIGIERRFQEKIFRIFQRLHSEEDIEGTGIGLALARKAVDRMGGRIWVDSELGKGSTFCVALIRA